MPPLTFDQFIARWTDSSGAERANKDAFLSELCQVLEVDSPHPTTGDPDRDTYVFEKDVVIPLEDGKKTIGRIDLYKKDFFILEAKQGSEALSKKLGTARRGTPAWNVAMQDAYGQSLGYARTIGTPPPFLIICDIGFCFDLYASFDGSGNYRKWPDALASRMFVRTIEKHAPTLRAIWTDPHSLDQSRIAARVTREIAGHIANLARALEAAGHKPELVAQFLMRCLFTMFAEDIELLKERPFARMLQERWISDPTLFKPEAEDLWKAMNEGGNRVGMGNILRFNGGLFADPTALPLTKEQLVILGLAASSDWRDVEPAIFGTLLERALDPKERHRLGAHFTPRAYVERLVRPTIEEPLRTEWEAARAEVRQIMSEAKSDDDKKAMVAARKPVYAFYDKLTQTRVLDPACGSGNFLYVTLDLFKRIENEILAQLHDLGDTAIFNLHGRSVTPEQFLGIEIKPWAKEIAELVLWIGYLQWQVRNRGWMSHPPEPVLRDYHNIECRDAVLAYDRIEPAVNDEGNPITRWDGETMNKHPITGEDVPDESAQVVVLKYVNPRKAEWPKADYIVGNPPYIGTWKFLQTLGEGYAEAVRGVYEQVPQSSDYVMYWWHKAALLVRAGDAIAFGLITTNGIRQPFGRRVVSSHLRAVPPLCLTFVVPDHPWVDSSGGADVRVALTVARASVRPGVLSTLVAEHRQTNGEFELEFKTRIGQIHEDLTVGAPLSACVTLLSNSEVTGRGFELGSDGFIVSRDELPKLGAVTRDGIQRFLRPYVNGRDIAGVSRSAYVIDLYGLTEIEARNRFPELFQHVLDRVFPTRQSNRDPRLRAQWWLHRRSREDLREMLSGLNRYVATVETSKHRYFLFLDSETVPDNKLVVIATADSFHLGVLSAKAHVLWATVNGGRMGVGNDPVYVKSLCFDPYPFPAPNAPLVQRIRTLGEQLDAHRKQRQQVHPDLTITGMYNVLDKVRSLRELTEKEKVIYEHGLISVLKEIHDDLDAAVFDAYGWPLDLTDEQILERLVALNAERAAEEKRGLIRWLRPEFQNPDNKGQDIQQQIEGASLEAVPSKAATPDGKPPWPKDLPDQLTAIRDTFHQSTTALDATTVAKSFKGARTKEVAQVLASLEALGHLISVSEEPRQWRAAR
ncbi:MAG: class I SAM-dependent DNA methyltransferase [Solirubrobacterales bacterium]